MVAANANFRLKYVDSLPNQSGDTPSKVFLRSFSPPPPTAEDIRIHAWISERIVALDRERHGLRSTVRHLLHW
jgi:hypothetical protein